jgi:hypothetical protein
VATLKTTLKSLLALGLIVNTGERESAVVYRIKLDVIATPIEVAQTQAANDAPYYWRIAAGLGGKAREAPLAAQECA